jgi:hypothetical protein
MVQNLLTTVNGNRVPVYNNATVHPTVTNRAQFNSWYVDDPTFNYPMTISLTVSNAETCDSLLYSYNNLNFFPLDHIGFGDSSDYSYNEFPTTKNHNFAFTFTASMRFTYQGYETFNFLGDDDVWIFINNQLAIVRNFRENFNSFRI